MTRNLKIFCLLFMCVILHSQGDLVKHKASLLSTEFSTYYSMDINNKELQEVSYKLDDQSLKTSPNAANLHDTVTVHIINNSRKIFLEFAMGLGFGGQESFSLSGVGTEVSLLQSFGGNSNHFLTISTGYESLKTLIPSYSIPLTIGYQYNINRDKNFKPFIFGKLGHGFTYLNEESFNTWETRAVSGGLRWEIGVGYSGRLSKNLGWNIKSSFLNQEMNIKSDNAWSQSNFYLELKRIFIKFGVVF